MKMEKWILILTILLSINLYAIDLADSSFTDFIRFVSNSTNKNFIIDENIDKKISIILPHKFNGKDSYKILLAVLNKNKMYITKVGNTYYIKKREDNKFFYSYKLQYLLPDKVIPIIKNYYSDLVISKSKKTIIFQCSINKHNRILKLLKMLDRPIKSKKIKITLISFKDEDIAEYGANYKVSNKTGDMVFSTFLNGLTSNSALTLNLSNITLNAFLQNLKTKNLIDYKFSPTLSLFDNEITTFNITQTIPYLSVDSSVNGDNDINRNSYEYKDVGSEILIDKVAITDTEVYFHVKMKYEVIIDMSITPVTAKRTIDNYIKLKHGQTLLITGIKSNQKSVVHKQIPLLGGIPYLGKMFQWKQTNNKIESFAIFIQNLNPKDEINNIEAYASNRKGVPPRSGGK